MDSFTNVMIIVLSVCVGLEFVIRLIDVILERKHRRLVLNLLDLWLNHADRVGYSTSEMIRAAIFLHLYGQLPSWASEAMLKEKNNVDR